MRFASRLAIFVPVTAASIAFDQVTKLIATGALRGRPTLSYLGDTFRLQWATNQGAFLSLGDQLPEAGRYWVLTIGVGVLLAGITVHALVAKVMDRPQLTGYALIASGGLSNWIDRARFDGSVVDFMNLGIGRLRTGIFNVADLAIVAGIAVLVIHGWKLDRAAKRTADRAQAGRTGT